MTPNEDMLLERLAGSAKLTLLWQALAAFTCWILTAATPAFWIPCAASMLAAVLSLVDILWTLPNLRRRVWESSWALDTYHCLRCDQDVTVGRCACTESPSPWEPKP